MASAPFQVYRDPPESGGKLFSDSHESHYSSDTDHRHQKQHHPKSLQSSTQRRRRPLQNLSNSSHGKQEHQSSTVNPVKSFFERLILSSRNKRSENEANGASTADNITKPLTTSERFEDASHRDKSNRRSHSQRKKSIEADASDLSEYLLDIMAHLKDLETRRRPSTTYMAKQRELTEEKRKQAIEWIVTTVYHFKHCQETLHLSVNYLDRFLSKKNVPNHRIQLVALTCTFIAAKYEEVTPLTLEDAVNYTATTPLTSNTDDNTNSSDDSHEAIPMGDLLAMEWCILDTLNFDLNVATGNVFLGRFLQLAVELFNCCDYQEILHNLSLYILELAFIDYGLLSKKNSLLSISALVLALDTLRLPFWNRTIEGWSGYGFEELKDCLQCLHRLLSRPPSLAVKRKFMQTENSRVALMRPRPFPPSLLR